MKGSGPRAASGFLLFLFSWARIQFPELTPQRFHTHLVCQSWPGKKNKAVYVLKTSEMSRFSPFESKTTKTKQEGTSSSVCLSNSLSILNWNRFWVWDRVAVRCVALQQRGCGFNSPGVSPPVEFVCSANNVCVGSSAGALATRKHTSGRSAALICELSAWVKV